MPPETLDLTRIRTESRFDDTVLAIVLSAEKGNVIDIAMMREIQSVLNQVNTKNSLKLIVFEADGENFSFGASVPEHTPEMCPELLKTFHGLFETLISLSVPTMAVVKGHCLGGAMELAGFCNFVVAAETAHFGVPEITLGVFPPPASIFLPLKVGQGRADAMVLTGESVDACTAQSMGLVNIVGADDQLNTLVEEFINKHIVPKSAIALRHGNAASRWVFNDTFRRACSELEAYFLKDLMSSHDAQEGINAFIAKRRPVWTHA